MWVAYARRPLRVEELAEVVAVDESADPILTREMRLFRPQDILKMLSGLAHPITIQTEEESFQAVSLVHSTIRAVIELRSDFFPPNPHLEIARLCLRYLCLLDKPDSVSPPGSPQHFPLATYAARFWHYHMQEADRLNDNLDQLLRVAADFFHDTDKIYLQNWVKLFNPDQPWILGPDASDKLPDILTPLYYASSLGLVPLVSKLLERGASNINAIGGAHGTALQAAAYHGHCAIVELLLTHGADPFKRGGLHGTALQAAKFVGHSDISDLLLASMQDQISGEAGQEMNVHLPRHIFLNRGEDPYEFRDILGSGRAGWVDKVQSLASGSICARKTMRITPDQRQRFVDELLLMDRLKHVHVVEVLGSYSIKPDFYILMEPVADSDLLKYMENKDGTANTACLSRWLGCLAKGLAYIHGQKVKHKDIKPSNLLIYDDNILYTDFDLAHGFQSLDDVTSGPTGQSLPYSAPEVVRGEERTTATDVFSLGCVYAEMLTVIGGREVSEIKSTLLGESGYSYRGPNGVKAAEWLQLLSFSDKQVDFNMVIDVTNRMLSQTRPSAATLAACVGFLGCNLC